MHTSLDVCRVFRPDYVPPSAASGLDFSRFDAYRGEAREAQPFAGISARRINSGEAFFQDAVRAIRDGELVIPNPFGAGTLATREVLVCPSIPWATVPLYVARFAGPEPFYFVKRGLSWCTDLGLVFPQRRLFVSFQQEDRRMTQDIADIEHAFVWFDRHGDDVANAPPRSPGPLAPCLIVTSDHFAHHIWNELSVVEGLVAEDLHREVTLLVNRQPLAPISTLFPEIPAKLIEIVHGPPDEPMRVAMRRGLLVAPAGRTYVPPTLVDRLRRVARAMHPQAATDAATFRARHDFVLWISVRLEARTATNLVEALAYALITLQERHPAMGVVFDGFTRPAGAPTGWNQALIDAERRAVAETLARTGLRVDHVALSGCTTTEAFLWAEVADYYVCPYGSAQHKVAWINPVPGLVHAGQNKQPVASMDAGFYVRQQGAPPQFFFAAVTRRDLADDARQDLFSYCLDPEAFTATLVADIAARAMSGAR